MCENYQELTIVWDDKEFELVVFNVEVEINYEKPIPLQTIEVHSTEMVFEMEFIVMNKTKEEFHFKHIKEESDYFKLSNVEDWYFYVTDMYDLEINGLSGIKVKVKGYKDGKDLEDNT